MDGNVFTKFSNINFYAYPFSGAVVVTYIITDIQRGLTGALQGCKWAQNESSFTCLEHGRISNLGFECMLDTT
jgi:hypothetical protein